jgi:hypothetical protein
MQHGTSQKIKLPGTPLFPFSSCATFDVVWGELRGGRQLALFADSILLIFTDVCRFFGHFGRKKCKLVFFAGSHAGKLFFSSRWSLWRFFFERVSFIHNAGMEGPGVASTLKEKWGFIMVSSRLFSGAFHFTFLLLSARGVKATCIFLPIFADLFPPPSNA